MSFDYNPFDEVTDFLEANDNWFGTIEDAQTECAPTSSCRSATRATCWWKFCAAWGWTWSWSPPDDTSSVVRRWDPDLAALDADPSCSSSGLKFQLAHTIGLG